MPGRRGPARPSARRRNTPQLQLTRTLFCPSRRHASLSKSRARLSTAGKACHQSPYVPAVGAGAPSGENPYCASIEGVGAGEAEGEGGAGGLTENSTVKGVTQRGSENTGKLFLFIFLSNRECDSGRRGERHASLSRIRGASLPPHRAAVCRSGVGGRNNHCAQC